MTERRKRATRARKPRVEVRKSGDGLALKVEGTFASWYQPGSEVTGSVWDAIAAPILALPEKRRKEILILGVQDVIDAAREHFDLDALKLDLVIADALDFLQDDKRRFDLILEDIFVGVGRSVHKPGWLPHPGHELAKARLKPGGLLVSNTLDEASEITGTMKGLFPGVLKIEVDEFENVIVVGGPPGLSATALRKEVASNPILKESAKALSFRTQQSSLPS